MFSCNNCIDLDIWCTVCVDITLSKSGQNFRCVLVLTARSKYRYKLRKQTPVSDASRDQVCSCVCIMHCFPFIVRSKSVHQLIKWSLLLFFQSLFPSNGALVLLHVSLMYPPSAWCCLCMIRLLWYGKYDAELWRGESAVQGIRQLMLNKLANISVTNERC